MDEQWILCGGWLDEFETQQDFDGLLTQLGSFFPPGFSGFANISKLTQTV